MAVDYTLLVLRSAGVHAAVPAAVVVQGAQEEEVAPRQQHGVVTAPREHPLPVLEPGDGGGWGPEGATV